MSTTKLNSREVLWYLNQMGYKNINAQQLKEFMQDLKKLIKYEERRRYRKEQYNNEDLVDYLSNESTFIPMEETVNEQGPLSDIFTRLYQQGTVESNAKNVQKKESVPIPKKRVKKIEKSVQSQDLDYNKENEIPTKLTQEKVNHENTKDISKTSSQKNKSSTINEDLHPNTPVDKQLPEKSTNKPKKIVKKTVAFIRPPTSKTNLKSDPVALYHQYKAEWSKVNIPGENNRAELRWAIREKMMSGARTRV